MKEKCFEVRDSAAYILCYQAPNQPPLADIHLSDGKQDVDSLINKRDALNKAIECLRNWQTGGE